MHGPLIMIPREWAHPGICFSRYETHSLTPVVAHLAGAEYLLALPARLCLQRLTCDTIDVLLAPHAGSKCNVVALLAHMMTPAEGDAPSMAKGLKAPYSTSSLFCAISKKLALFFTVSEFSVGLLECSSLVRGLIATLSFIGLGFDSQGWPSKPLHDEYFFLKIIH
jgi:hypothetical protein